jgi:hypothetical protein
MLRFETKELGSKNSWQTFFQVFKSNLKCRLKIFYFSATFFGKEGY